MDWTSIFAVIGAVFLLVAAAITISTVSVLGWIGLKYVAGIYKDEQRNLRSIEQVADEYFRKDGRR